MRFSVNNKIIDQEEQLTIMDLLNNLGYHKWCLVLLNDITLPQSEYEKLFIKDGDNIRIFKPLFGG